LYIGSSVVLCTDIQALCSLSLTSLKLSASLDVAGVQAIGRMHTLRTLSLLRCDAVFQMEGARALSGLSAAAAALTTLTLEVLLDMPTAVKAAELLLQSFHILVDLTLGVYTLTTSLAHAIAQHSSLACLTLRPDTIEPSALAILLSESKSISSLSVLSGRHVAVPFEYLQRNVHLLTHQFEAMTNIDSVEYRRMKYKHESRNHRLLHNWRCICVLLASYRANVHSPIRDSMLSLMMDVMCRSGMWNFERLRMTLNLESKRDHVL
jgi:hypothetical protein